MKESCSYILQVKRDLNVVDNSPPRSLLSSCANGSAPYLESLKKFPSKNPVIDGTKRDTMLNYRSVLSNESNRPYPSEEGCNLHTSNSAVKDSAKEFSYSRPAAPTKLNTLTNILQRRVKNSHKSY